MKRILIVVLLFVLSQALPAQPLSSNGTDFWIGFMPNKDGAALRISLTVASASSTNIVTVEYYGGGTGGVTKQTVTFDAPLSKTVALDVTKSESRDAETAKYAAVHVKAEKPVSVSAISYQHVSADGYLALPLPFYGREYRSVNFKDQGGVPVKYVGEFLVIAPYDSTTVTITAAAQTRKFSTNNGFELSHNEGETWSVTLRKGQTYLVQSLGSKGSDLTGSVVKSNKPISMISGHSYADFSADSNAGVSTYKGFLSEMLPPVERWGTASYGLPLIGVLNHAVTFRVLSSEPDQEIYVQDSNHFAIPETLSVASRFIKLDTTVPLNRVSSNKKFLLMSYYGGGNHLEDFNGIGYPALCTIPDTTSFASGLGSMSYPEIFAPTLKFKSHHNAFLIDSFNAVNLIIQPFNSFYDTTAFPYKILADVGQTIVGYFPKVTTFPTKTHPYAATMAYGDSAGTTYFPAIMGGINVSTDLVKPVAVGTSDCGDFDIIVSDPKESSDNSWEGGRLYEVRMITDALDSVTGLKPSSNYRMKDITSFIPGNTSYHFRFEVIDRTKPAHASLSLSDLAGNRNTYNYDYDGKSASLVLPTTRLDKYTFMKNECKTFVYRVRAGLNPNDEVIIPSVNIFDGDPGFTISNVSPTLPATLKAGDSLVITVCLTAQDTGKLYTATITAVTDCFSDDLTIQGKGATGLLEAQDVNFPEGSFGVEQCVNINLFNNGDAPLTLTGSNTFNGSTHFKVQASFTFPKTIAPRSSISMPVCFDHAILTKDSVRLEWGTDLVAPFDHSIKTYSILKANLGNIGVAEEYTPRSLSITSITPNPAHNEVTLSFETNESSALHAEIFDLLGNTKTSSTFSSDKGKQSVIIPLTQLASGNYILRLSAGNLTASKMLKVVK